MYSLIKGGIMNRSIKLTILLSAGVLTSGYMSAIDFNQLIKNVNKATSNVPPTVTAIKETVKTFESQIKTLKETKKLSEQVYAVGAMLDSLLQALSQAIIIVDDVGNIIAVIDAGVGSGIRDGSTVTKNILGTAQTSVPPIIREIGDTVKVLEELSEPEQ